MNDNLVEKYNLYISGNTASLQNGNDCLFHCMPHILMLYPTWKDEYSFQNSAYVALNLLPLNYSQLDMLI